MNSGNLVPRPRVLNCHAQTPSHEDPAQTGSMVTQVWAGGEGAWGCLDSTRLQPICHSSVGCELVAVTVPHVHSCLVRDSRCGKQKLPKARRNTTPGSVLLSASLLQFHSPFPSRFLVLGTNEHEIYPLRHVSLCKAVLSALSAYAAQMKLYFCVGTPPLSPLFAPDNHLSTF